MKLCYIICINYFCRSLIKGSSTYLYTRNKFPQVTPQDEERAVHESYQILLLEYQAKKLTREKKSRERLKSNELKAKLEAEAAALQAEQDKIKTDMDKFFDSSGSVVSMNRVNIYQANEIRCYLISQVVLFSSFFSFSIQSRLSAPTSSSKRRGSTANLGDGTGSPSLNRTRSVNVGSMMRTNTALLRFKKSSKSFKTRKDKETVAEVEEVGDVNWTMD